jgi:Site-specific recombinase XerD
MSIQKKNGKWYAAVYLGMENGKQKYEWSDGYDLKPDAQLKEIEMKKDVIQRSHVVRKKESFVSVSESWFSSRKKIIAPTTYRQNEWYYNHYIKPYFKDFMISKIDTQDIVNFMSGLNVAPGTVNKAMNILKQIFDLAVLYGYIRYNPCTGVKKPRIKTTRKPTWTQNEIRDFLNLKDVKECTGYIAFCLLFTTGMRPGEVCGLRWCDWCGECLLPAHGIDNFKVPTDLKNEFAHQEVYIGSKLQAELKKSKKYQREYCIANGLKFSEENYINCFEPDLRPMTPEYLRKSLERILKHNGIDKISPYSARHSFGTNMMRNGVNPKKVSEAMRHSSVRTTLDRYSHVDADMKKKTFSEYADGVL